MKRTNYNQVYCEERRNAENIPYYGEVCKEIKIQKNNYEYEMIREALKTFIRADKNVMLSKSNSRFFYNKQSVDILLELLKNKNLKHKIGCRNISKDKEHFCFEINFQIVLDRTKPEIF